MAKSTINVRGELLDLSVPRVMGILNVTPDSFYKGSRIIDKVDVVNKVRKMISDGMDIVDVGGYSSRPGAKEVSLKEELDRVIPIIEIISSEFPELPISIDTFRSEVVEKSISAGAGIVNDISAGEMDVDMFATVAQFQVPYIAMHMKGTPQNMQDNPTYDDVMLEMIRYFSEKVNKLRQMNVNDIILDPGFGFGKTLSHNYEILNRFQLLQNIGLPILTGISRKSMINKVLQITPDQALNGTTVLNTIALTKGTNILRVHDVREAKQSVLLWGAVNSGVD
jgi:dihydropteroate synthase